MSSLEEGPDFKPQLERFVKKHRLRIAEECFGALINYYKYGLNMGGFMTALHNDDMEGIEMRAHPNIRHLIDDHKKLVDYAKKLKDFIDD
jgi:hypothetical protein